MIMLGFHINSRPHKNVLFLSHLLHSSQKLQLYHKNDDRHHIVPNLSPHSYALIVLERNAFLIGKRNVEVEVLCDKNQ